jgi:hypothetical protein
MACLALLMLLALLRPAHSLELTVGDDGDYGTIAEAIASLTFPLEENVLIYVQMGPEGFGEPGLSLSFTEAQLNGYSICTTSPPPRLSRKCTAANCSPAAPGAARANPPMRSST